MLLEVTGLSVNYGHIEAIRDISFGVEEAPSRL
jgi:branched-chain amino acid transport system ATP-binding protein